MISGPCFLSRVSKVEGPKWPCTLANVDFSGTSLVTRWFQQSRRLLAYCLSLGVWGSHLSRAPRRTQRIEESWFLILGSEGVLQSAATGWTRYQAEDGRCRCLCLGVWVSETSTKSRTRQFNKCAWAQADQSLKLPSPSTLIAQEERQQGNPKWLNVSLNWQLTQNLGSRKN